MENRRLEINQLGKLIEYLSSYAKTEAQNEDGVDIIRCLRYFEDHCKESLIWFLGAEKGDVDYIKDELNDLVDTGETLWFQRSYPGCEHSGTFKAATEALLEVFWIKEHFLDPDATGDFDPKQFDQAGYAVSLRKLELLMKQLLDSEHYERRYVNGKIVGSKSGLMGGKKRRTLTEERNKKIVADAQELLAEGRPSRSIVGILAKRDYGRAGRDITRDKLTPQQIRSILKKVGVYPFPK